MTKYTKEYLEENEIAIQYNTKEEFNAIFSKLSTLGEEKSLNTNFDEILKITRFISRNTKTKNFDSYNRTWKGETIITAKEFLEDHIVDTNDKVEDMPIAVFSTPCPHCKKPICSSRIECPECGKNVLIKPNKQMEEAMKNPGILDIKKLYESEDSLTLTGDTLRRHRIQEKIEEGVKGSAWTFASMLSLLEWYIKDNKDNGVFVEEIAQKVGKEDLKFFFNIKETMTMREAIEQEKNFEFEGKEYAEQDCKLYIDFYMADAESVGIDWILKNQDKQVRVL